jgi:hypothetical protein
LQQNGGWLTRGPAAVPFRSRSFWIGQYYDTALGAGRPHAGGAWLKTLGNLSEPTPFIGI